MFWHFVLSTPRLDRIDRVPMMNDRLATGANESHRTELAQKGAFQLIMAAMSRHANSASVRMDLDRVV